MIPSSNESITYEVLREEDYGKAANMISTTFCEREPITKLLGLKTPEFEEYVNIVLNMNPGISYVAKFGNEIVAALINDVPTNIISFDEETCKRISPKFEIYDQILKDLDEEIIQEYVIEKKVRMVHIDLLGIAEAYSGRGIASKLLAFAKNDLKRQGFDTLMMECTNICSERLAWKDGWKHRKTINYQTWSHNGKLPLSTIDTKHSLVLFETKL